MARQIARVRVVSDAGKDAIPALCCMEVGHQERPAGARRR